MTNNKRLAEIVAERLSDRLEEQMMDLLQEITTDVLEENGLNTDDDEAWETMMDVAGRVYIGAQQPIIKLAHTSTIILQNGILYIYIGGKPPFTTYKQPS